MGEILTCPTSGIRQSMKLRALTMSPLLASSLKSYVLEEFTSIYTNTDITPNTIQKMAPGVNPSGLSFEGILLPSSCSVGH